MARVTEAEVKEIIVIDDKIVPSLTPFITASSLIVNEHCSELDETTAKEVERWLSAHLSCAMDTRVDTEKAGPVSQKFQYKIDLGLDQTVYGQTAKGLDSSGGLAKWDELVKSGKAGTKVKICYLGTNYNE